MKILRNSVCRKQLDLQLLEKWMKMFNLLFVDDNRSEGCFFCINQCSFYPFFSCLSMTKCGFRNRRKQMEIPSDFCVTDLFTCEMNDLQTKWTQNWFEPVKRAGKYFFLVISDIYFPSNTQKCLIGRIWAQTVQAFKTCFLENLSGCEISFSKISSSLQEFFDPETTALPG